MLDDQNVFDVTLGERFLEARKFRNFRVEGRPASDPSPHTRQTPFASGSSMLFDNPSNIKFEQPEPRYLRKHNRIDRVIGYNATIQNRDLRSIDHTPEQS